MTGVTGGRAQPLIFPSRILATSVLSLLLLGCGYGFGNHAFRDMRSTAVAFAKALQAGDTSQMRQLSWGRMQDSARGVAREVPNAYIRFAKPAPELVTTDGGGVYGSSVVAAFLVTSTELSSCHGGVELEVLMLDKRPRVTSLRLIPPPDSVTDEACRAAIYRDSR